MGRVDFLRSLIDVGGIGLEIGPSYNPLLPKSEGFRVETVDYTDCEGLRAKYKGSPHADIAKIETVDHIIRDNALAESIGRSAYYDYIVASHVIEHTPDMLSFLNDCERLLKADGILLLAVPDKRHCFDVFQPLTSTGAILQAHYDERRRPGLGAIFDDRAYNAVRAGAIGWTADDDQPLNFFLDEQAAITCFKSDCSVDTYIDVHVWKFVPSSFRLILNDLSTIRKTALRELQFFDSVGNEFYMTLSTRGAGCPVDRLTLAKRMLVEQATIKPS